MKKSISLVLLILTLFTLSACKKEASMPEKGDPITFKATVLSVETDLESIFVEADKKGGKEIYNVKCEAAARLQKACRHLQNEAHLLTGFVRFKEISSVLIAEITPKIMALPLIAPNFVLRIPQEGVQITQ